MLEGSALNLGQARVDEGSPSVVLSRVLREADKLIGRAGHTYATADCEQ